MKKSWWDAAWDDYAYWQKQDKRTLRKINGLVRDIERSGGKGIGQAELLKGNLAGWSSVRIDGKNRLVYKITGEKENRTIEILQCRGHY
jgi:toxin YoeB